MTEPGFQAFSHFQFLEKGGQFQVVVGNDVPVTYRALINEMGGTATYTRVKNTMAAARSEAAARPAAPTVQVVDRAAHAGRVRGAEYYRRRRGDADAQ